VEGSLFRKRRDEHRRCHDDTDALRPAISKSCYLSTISLYTLAHVEQRHQSTLSQQPGLPHVTAHASAPLRLTIDHHSSRALTRTLRPSMHLASAHVDTSISPAVRAPRELTMSAASLAGARNDVTHPATSHLPRSCGQTSRCGNERGTWPHERIARLWTLL
jgi:hypothetical protein